MARMVLSIPAMLSCTQHLLCCVFVQPLAHLGVAISRQNDAFLTAGNSLESSWLQAASSEEQLGTKGRAQGSTDATSSRG